MRKFIKKAIEDHGYEVVDNKTLKNKETGKIIAGEEAESVKRDAINKKLDELAELVRGS